MCDTLVVVRPEGVWFAKNSDRDPNEAQGIDWVGPRDHADGAEVRCTWKVIPQVRRTHGVVLSRPFWMWGAEMGANEHGVVIGNEAVFTKEPMEEVGLTGMDLVRLGLERGGTAEEAVEVIRGLIEAVGQGGRAGYSHPGFSYHNSFLVADPGGAFVVETAGREVVVEPVVSGVRAISNGLTLPALMDRADRVRGKVAACEARRSRMEELAAEATEVRDLTRVLRDHGAGYDRPRYQRLRGAMTGPCMHYGGLVAGSQTVGSWVASLTEEGGRHWVTGTSAPCMSLFRPIDLFEPAPVGRPEGCPDGESLWWRFEAIHRRWLVAPEGLELAKREREALEEAAFATPHEWRDHWAAADEWLARQERWLEKGRGDDGRPAWLRRLWEKVEDEAAGGNRLPARAAE